MAQELLALLVFDLVTRHFGMPGLSLRQLVELKAQQLLVNVHGSGFDVLRGEELLELLLIEIELLRAEVSSLIAKAKHFFETRTVRVKQIRGGRGFRTSHARI